MPGNSHMWMRDNTRYLGLQCYDCHMRKSAPLRPNEKWQYNIFWQEYPDYDHNKDD